MNRNRLPLKVLEVAVVETSMIGWCALKNDYAIYQGTSLGA